MQHTKTATVTMHMHTSASCVCNVLFERLGDSGGSSAAWQGLGYPVLNRPAINRPACDLRLALQWSAIGDASRSLYTSKQPANVSIKDEEHCEMH
jgi:hypothetical protein